MRIGILGTADIAYRRFLPALSKCGEFTYAGVASRTPEKGKLFQKEFGGAVYNGYDALLTDESIEAVYVPLPPALHYEWGRKALEAGKHLLLEKPFTVSIENTERLIALARAKNLAIHENYMFLYHSQMQRIRELITSGELGEIRLYRMSFGFPIRGETDFRYDKALGGGALLDCGGYPVRMALELLGPTAKVTQARLIQPMGYEVDLYGSAVIENDAGQCAQISFGMDNAYQCQLEVWGSKATLIAPRVFTAGADVRPGLILRSSVGETTETLTADDQFLHSLERFGQSVRDAAAREEMYEKVRMQSAAVTQLRRKGGTP